MTTTTRRHEGSRSAYLGAILAAYVAKCGATPSPVFIGRLVEDMQRAARASKGWEERRCNEPMTEAQTERGEKRIQRMQDKINAGLLALVDGGTLAAEYAPTVDLGGDVRGPCGVLLIPGQENDGCGDGFAIYQEGAR
jgi:hypothetical protein